MQNKFTIIALFVALFFLICISFSNAKVFRPMDIGSSFKQPKSIYGEYMKNKQEMKRNQIPFAIFESINAIADEEQIAQSENVTCPVLSCNLIIGDTCSSYCDLDGNLTVCDICSIGNYCDEQSDECVERVAVGGSCTSSIQCVLPTEEFLLPFCNQTNQCSFRPTFSNGLAGDYCDSVFTCDYDMACTNNTCTPKGQGESCQSRYGECGYDLYCNVFPDLNNATCQPSKAIGDACTFSYECNSFDFLSSEICANGVCIQSFSKAVGESCTEEMGECEFGTYCNQNSVCAVIPEQISCESDSQCTDGTTCTCLYSTTEPTSKCMLTGINTIVDPMAEELYSSAVQCYNDNQCVGRECFDACSLEFLCLQKLVLESMYSVVEIAHTCFGFDFPSDEQCAGITPGGSSQNSNSQSSTGNFASTSVVFNLATLVFTIVCSIFFISFF